LAKLYLDHQKGYGYESREWRIYHVERYIEIIAQISLTSDPNLDQLGVDDWVLAWGERTATIQAAAAASLEAFIEDGEVPEAA
jgi:hypothetical protein